MTILDAKLLLYAYDADAPQQSRAAEWLNALIASPETIALPWITIWAFVRIRTNARLCVNPRPAGEAFAIMERWLGQGAVVQLNPGPLHLEILKGLVKDYNVAGPRLTDAVLAALAIEHGAVLASTDQDFRRFPNLRWIDPLNPQRPERA